MHLSIFFYFIFHEDLKVCWHLQLTVCEYEIKLINAALKTKRYFPETKTSLLLH